MMKRLFRWERKYHKNGITLKVLMVNIYFRWTHGRKSRRQLTWLSSKTVRLGLTFRQKKIRFAHRFSLGKFKKNLFFWYICKKIPGGDWACSYWWHRSLLYGWFHDDWKYDDDNNDDNDYNVNNEYECDNGDDRCMTWQQTSYWRLFLWQRSPHKEMRFLFPVILI